MLLPSETKKRQCKVLFEYIPQNEDELELKVGDIIDINEEVRNTYVLEIKQQLELMLWVLEKYFVRMLIFVGFFFASFTAFCKNFKIHTLKWISSDLMQGCLLCRNKALLFIAVPHICVLYLYLLTLGIKKTFFKAKN